VTADPLLDVPALVAALAEPDPPTILDVRWRLGEPTRGQDDYRSGHIPGAVFLDLDGQLCGPPGRGGRHPLPDPARLEAVLQAAGVRKDHPVVVYDGGEPDPSTLAAARAWWTLRWAGHPRVQVLDGGYAAWEAAEQRITTAVPHPDPGNFRVRPGGMPVLAAEDAARLAREGVLLDVRAPVRYRGEQEPVDPVAGHIPGAVNAPAAGNLTGQGRWREPDQLSARFAQLGVVPEAPVGAYCGSGVVAAHTVLALHRAGRTDAALYVGSWSHWITDPDRPTATGEEP
jgi:thiosulfate/3-mercaptopyruvate sulfurtransferase